MAISGNAFSPKEFELAICQETTCGTAKVDAMLGINIDSISFPTLNPTQVMDVRSHSGRVAQDIDVFLSKAQTVKEISFAGVLHDEIAPNFIEGVIGSATSDAESANELFQILDTYSPGEIVYGATSGDRAFTYTVAMISPVSGKSVTIPGMVFTSLTISADMGEEAGRIKFEATMQSGKSANFDQTVTVATDYSANYYSMGDMAFRTVAGVADQLLQSFSLTVENPANFHGYSGNDFEVISRAIPEISVNCDVTMKYDANSLELDAAFGGTQAAGGAVTTIGTGAAIEAGTDNKFSFEMHNSIITNYALNEGAAMLVDLSLKGLADPSESNAQDKAALSIKI
jgi:hypothetical protein|tara:strand:- start:14066 stop:15094 length:1029 start_codon:yes stop_codon:yes gene_type:complete